MSSVTSSNVYFRFLGDRSNGVTPVDAVVPRKHLEKAPNSLMSKLAKDVWKSDEKAGTDVVNPIVTKPMEAPCKDEWSPVLASMIVNAYEYYAAKKDSSSQTEEEGAGRVMLKLPKGIELEDALVVLDYYGLNDEDPTLISLDETDDVAHVRAKLFLQQMAQVEKAKKFVVEHLKKEPKWTTYFHFPEDDRCKFGYITNSSRPLVKVLDAEDSDWLVNQRLKATFPSLLEDIGFEACFVDGVKCYFKDCQWGSPGVSELLVLCVTVPKAVKRRRLEKNTD